MYAQLATECGAHLQQDDIAYPKTPYVIDVTQSPYFARGDGITDDTDAIQQALTDTMGQHKMLYFPNGTYLISRTLRWTKKNSEGRDAWGKNFLQGQNAHKTIIRLRESTFTDPKQPQSMMWCGGFGSADWFHNYVQNMTWDVGAKNPGAIALQFYSNNSGAVRHCRFLAESGSGSIGLDLGHSDMNGPLLVHHCEILGFQRGIRTARAVNGQTMEHLTLRDQQEVGLENEGQCLSLRGLWYQGSAPAIRSYGVVTLIDSKLEGHSQAKNFPSIINYNGGRILVRDVVTSGFARSIGDVATPDWTAALRLQGEDKSGSLGPNVEEYASHTPTRPFPSLLGSLRLQVQEPPTILIDPPSQWTNVDDFGADPTAQKDSSEAIQKAIDSGATTLFLPGSYALHSTVVIRGKVRRVIGVGGMIDYFRKVQPDFRIEDGDGSTLSIEHFAYIHGGIEIDSKRTLLFRSVADCDLQFTSRSRDGQLFLEDFVTHDLDLRHHRTWARQLNVENEGTHVRNEGGHLWVLGYKTERGGTLLETSDGGKSEILGGFSYTTTAGKLAPMFVTKNSNVYAFFHEVCYNGDPFTTLIQETHDDETRIVRQGEGTTSPYRSHPQ